MPRKIPDFPLKLNLLGPFRLESESGPLRLSTRKVESLLAFLVLHPEAQSREKLATLFWGDFPEARARQSLRTALSKLRRELGENLLLVDRETVQLNPDYSLRADVRELELLTGVRWQELDAEGVLRAARPLSLYQGDLLADFMTIGFSARARVIASYTSTSSCARQGSCARRGSTRAPLNSRSASWRRTPQMSPRISS